MPMVARLDLRLAYRPRGVSGRWEMYVEGLNVLNHNNAWFMDADIVDRTVGSRRCRKNRSEAFPACATFGLRFRFRQCRGVRAV